MKFAIEFVIIKTNHPDKMIGFKGRITPGDFEK